MTTTDSTTAVLGLGAMGSRMAAKLLERGRRVVVWNRSAAASRELVASGARSAATPREAAEAADRILVMVTDDDASRQVWLGDDGVVHGLHEQAIGIESSTVSPRWVRELGRAVAAAGASLLESPVLGSRPQAEAGQLICLTAGAPETLDSCRELLESFAARIVFLGEHGRAAVAKLAVNMLFAVQVEAAAEAVDFLRRNGVDDERWLDLFTSLPIVPPPIAGGMQAMAAGQFDPLFPIELVAKDLRYFSRAASEASATHPVAQEVGRLFAAAVEAGHGGDNITGILRLISGGAGD